MIESSGSEKEKEVWESLNDLIIERAEAIMYKGGIQALELLKIDKKTIKALEKNLKEEQAFGDWHMGCKVVFDVLFFISSNTALASVTSLG